MDLLHTIFPGLENVKEEFIPGWPNKDAPWTIISDELSSIHNQIKVFTGSKGTYIDPTAVIGENVRIEGPSYIGPNVEIRHGAYLRKGSWICEGALVGHCSEIKNSVLLPGAKAPHFNYVGDSIVGFGANLGSGAKLSNVRHDKREILVELENGSREETGLRKLGALIGDRSQLGCNVVTNPGSIIPPSSMVFPNYTVSGWFISKS